MKKISFVLLSGLFLVSCGSEKKDDAITTSVINIPETASGKPATPGSAPAMIFAEELHDFGKITQGEVVSWSFRFRNVGGSDLVISAATGSCGCTIPSYPKGAIKPGEESQIDVKFDSGGKSGMVKKTVTLTTNCSPSTKVITIQATVDVPEEE
ncbi:MAG: DUF1573 domain-containing protein [Bacteroidia bacterium]